MDKSSSNIIWGNNMNYQQAYEKLNKINQTHLLKFFDELNEEEKNISYYGKKRNRFL